PRAGCCSWAAPTGPFASRASTTHPLRPRRTRTRTPPKYPLKLQLQADPRTKETNPMARVLVVDDAVFMRKVVSDALAKGGHEVIGEAANGQEAVDQFQSLKPEVMTLDITMPGKDG